MAADGGVRALNTARASERTLPLLAPSNRLALVLGAIVLIGGFGDGIGFALAFLTGQRSPWVFLLPVLVIPILLYLLVRGPRAIRDQDKLLLLFFAALSGVILLVEWRVVGD